MKYSEHRIEEGVGGSFLHISGQEVGQRAIHPCGSNRHRNHPGNLEHLSYFAKWVRFHCFFATINKSKRTRSNTSAILSIIELGQHYL
jgi:hypothetical protein